MTVDFDVCSCPHNPFIKAKYYDELKTLGDFLQYFSKAKSRPQVQRLILQPEKTGE